MSAGALATRHTTRAGAASTNRVEIGGLDVAEFYFTRNLRFTCASSLCNLARASPWAWTAATSMLV